MHDVGRHGDATPLDDDAIRVIYDFPSQRPWVRASMVTTLDGVIRGADGDSRSIASAADRRVFSLLRLRADVVLVGAGTLRSVDYPPSRLPIAIVSRSLDLSPALRLFTAATPTSPRPIVYTSEASLVDADDALMLRADVVALGRTQVDLRGVVSDLATRELGRIHCEGGPQLLSGLVEAGLVDELLLTVTPRLRGGDDSDHLLHVGGGLSERLHFVSALEEDGSVFLRAVRPHPG